jgi:large subunit ribosomal protein L18
MPQRILQKSHRARIFGTSERPRLSVFRSNRHIYAQIIDDTKGVTLVSASDFQISKIKGTKQEIARAVGRLVGEKAMKKKIKKVVFDRGKFRYHGRVKALAEGAREAGLIF